MKTKPKHAAPTMPLKKAVEKGKEMLSEMQANGASYEDADFATLTRLIDFADTPDDRTLANEVLILSGILCAALAILLAIVGSIYVPLGNLVASEALQPYAGGFGLAALLCHLGVRR